MKSVLWRSLALVLLMVLSPFFFCIMLVIWLEDGGSVFFRQLRVGYQKKQFTVYKFRTMYDRPWPIQDVQGNDIRVTRPGRFLRKTHIDELPQLWNIVKGDMVFVGPRPQSCQVAERCSIRYPKRHANRFHFFPGLTGLAQIYTEKGVTRDLFRYIALDELYRKKKSPFLDSVIIIKTLIKMGKGTSS